MCVICAYETLSINVDFNRVRGVYAVSPNRLRATRERNHCVLIGFLKFFFLSKCIRLFVVHCEYIRARCPQRPTCLGGLHPPSSCRLP